MVHVAQFSDNYNLQIKRGEKGEIVIQVDGPIPVIQHRKYIVDLEDAKQTAYGVARRHFAENKISEDIIPVEQIKWRFT